MLSTVTLLIAIIPCYILLLTLTAAILLALTRFIVIRTRVLCAIKVYIFSESSHEVSNVLASALEPPKLLLERHEVTVLF